VAHHGVAPTPKLEVKELVEQWSVSFGRQLTQYQYSLVVNGSITHEMKQGQFIIRTLR
jgi:hypothetical protein